jgi:hypothetical protein
LREHEQGARRVLIHVNNLENLSHEEAARAARLFQDVRDFFLIAGTHWVFVGTSEIERTIVRATDAVSGIVPIVATLAPLSADEVVAMLELRYEQLRVGTRDVVRPVESEAVRRLYARYDGDLRHFLRLLSHAVQRAANAGAGSLRYAGVVREVAESYWTEVLRRVGQGDGRHLQVIAAGHEARATYRLTDLQPRAGLSKGAAVEFVERLVGKGVLAFADGDGTGREYRMRPDVEVGLGVLYGCNARGGRWPFHYRAEFHCGYRLGKDIYLCSLG